MNKKIAEFLNTKKRKVDFKNMMFAKDKIYIFLKNSYFIILSLDGKIEEINKLPNNMYGIGNNFLIKKGSKIEKIIKNV